MTGAALKQFEGKPAWQSLVQNTWVYARVSPLQKEYILTSLKTLGYTTLMAGDGTNDVGALKQAHIGVALLDGSPEDLQKIAEHAKNERIKKAYEVQLKVSQRFNQPPPPVPPVIAHLYPDLVEAQKKALDKMQNARKKNPMEKVCRSFPESSALTNNHFHNSLTLQQSRMLWPTWMTTTNPLKSNSAMLLARPPSHRSYRTYPQVSLILRKDLSYSGTERHSSPSFEYHSPGPMHTGCNDSDVQDSRVELPYHRI